MGLISTLTPAQQVQLLYIGYFNRAADAGGDIFWNNAYATLSAQGQSTTQILTTFGNDFTQQPTTLANYPFLAGQGSLSASNPTEVAAVNGLLVTIYANLFSETVSASDPGLQFWANLLLNNQISLGTAILQIADGATGTGLTALNNKIAAGTFFTTETAGASLGLSSPTASLLSQAALSVTAVNSTSASVTASESATTTFIASGGGGNGSTIEIVAGTFTYNGTTGNDTFIADNTHTTGVGGVANFNALDTINGGGGTDLLQVYSDATATGISFTPSQIAGISTFWINNIGANTIDVSGIAGLKTLQLNAPLNAPGANATANLAGQGLTISNDSVGGHTFTITSAVDTTESITVNAAGVTGADTFVIAGTKVTSATVTAAGSALDHVVIDNGVVGKLATLNIGNGPTLAVAFDASDTALTTVNASSDMGIVNVDLSTLPGTPADLSFTGGSCTTTLTISQAELDALTAGSQLNGGTATSGNTLDLSGVTGTLLAADYTEINAATGFQTLGFSNLVAGGATVDASKVTAFTSFSDFDGTGHLLTINNLAATGETVNVLADSVLDLTGVAGGSTVTLNVGDATSLGLNTLVTAGNITTFDLNSNGAAASTGNVVGFDNPDTTTYVVGGSTNLDITSVGNTVAKVVDATSSSFTGQLAIGVDFTHPGFSGFVGGDTLASGTSGFGDTIKLGSGTSIVVEQANEAAAGIKVDTITLATTHAASTVAYAGAGVTFAPGANLELVNHFTLGQDSVAISGHVNTYTAGDVTLSGFTISSSGLVTAGASNLMAFEAGLVTAKAAAIGDTIAYNDGTHTYVAEATAAAAADSWHVIELAGVQATHGVSISHGLAVIA